MLQVLFLIAIAAWWMCPIAMVVAARDRGQHGARVVYGLVAEAMLWVLQLCALLPMVSEGAPYL